MARYRRGRGRGGRGGMMGMAKKALIGAVAGYAVSRFVPQAGVIGALGAGFLAGGPVGAAGAYLGPRLMSGGGLSTNGSTNPV